MEVVWKQIWKEILKEVRLTFSPIMRLRLVRMETILKHKLLPIIKLAGEWAEGTLRLELTVWVLIREPMVKAMHAGW
jgi:hypothetical protein